MRYSQRTRQGNLPVSSKPPIQSERRPYGPARRQCQRRSLKIERINDKMSACTPRVETTRLRYAATRQRIGTLQRGHWTQASTQLNQIRTYKRQLNAKRRNGLPEMRSDRAATRGRPATFLQGHWTQTLTWTAQNATYKR